VEDKTLKSHCFHHVNQTRSFITRRGHHTATTCHGPVSVSLLMDQMDQNSFKSHSTRNNFFSRVYTTSNSSNTPRPYLSTTRPPLNTPSFFGKSHIPAGRSSESHITSATFQAGESSPLHPSAVEEGGSIYARHRAHHFISHSVEDSNNQHARDDMDGIARGPLPPPLEPPFYTSRAGMPNSSLLSL
jgi:hypothetical protein